MNKQDVIEAIDEAIEDEKKAIEESEYPLEEAIEIADTLFCQLVKEKRIGEYTLHDMMDTMNATAAILRAAKEEGLVADDPGLWESTPPYGVVASIAFFSLENLVYNRLRELGYDL